MSDEQKHPTRALSREARIVALVNRGLNNTLTEADAVRLCFLLSIMEPFSAHFQRLPEEKE